MSMIRKRTMRRRAVHYAGITLGCFIASCSINLFLVPSHLLTGGVTGIAIIFYYLAELPIGVQTLLYNIPLLVAAWKLMGEKYTIDIIIGTVIFSLCLDATQFLNAYLPVEDVMLAAIFGGVFNGIGYGIVFRMDGSTGGFDIIGAIVKKYYSLHMGGVIFGFNCLIMLAAAFLFGVTPAMFTLISMFINAMVTDKVIAGFNSRKAVLIVSGKAERIAEEIIVELGRGVTFLHGQGAFTHQERDVIFVAVKLTQVAKIKLIANEVDAHAFMIIMSANEVMGRGFSRPASRPVSEVIHEPDNRVEYK
ncbi:YitT family protein [Anaerovibrio sp.]|uniref:YitT family protein n=1 Tax=Anaerovibrio sp. TaxID=1872532 RepID=UPI003F184D83